MKLLLEVYITLSIWRLKLHILFGWNYTIWKIQAYSQKNCQVYDLKRIIINLYESFLGTVFLGEKTFPSSFVPVPNRHRQKMSNERSGRQDLVRITNESSTNPTSTWEPNKKNAVGRLPKGAGCVMTSCQPESHPMKLIILEVNFKVMLLWSENLHF